MTSRIKILFLIDRLLPGGTENQLILLSEGLNRSNFEPLIGVLEKTDYLKKLELKTPIIDFSSGSLPARRNFSLFWKLHRYLKREAIHVLQTHVVYATIYGAWAARFCRHHPILITTRRNLYHWVHEVPWSYQLFRHTASWTDCVLVNSHRVYEECQRVEHIPPEKITLINNAVEIRRFTTVSCQNAKRILGFTDQFPIIGVVANWRPIKGLVSFLQAAALVSREIPSARFVLAGEGPQEDELRGFARELGIQDRVDFFRNFHDIPTLISAFDIAVQPSLSESFSNVLLEYMAAGRPIVATRVGDAELIIDDGENGLLVAPNNPDDLAIAILRLCRDSDMAAHFGTRAQKKVEANWAYENILMTYQAFYQKLLAAKVRRK